MLPKVGGTPYYSAARNGFKEACKADFAFSD